MFRYYCANHCKLNEPSPPSVAHALLVDINTLALPRLFSVMYVIPLIRLPSSQKVLSDHKTRKQ